MLVRAAGTGDSPHTALISESVPTGWFLLITSIASTARCLGAPIATDVRSTLVKSGPRTPKLRLGSTILVRLPGRLGLSVPF